MGTVVIVNYHVVIWKHYLEVTGRWNGRVTLDPESIRIRESKDAFDISGSYALHFNASSSWLYSQPSECVNEVVTIRSFISIDSKCHSRGTRWISPPSDGKLHISVVVHIGSEDVAYFQTSRWCWEWSTTYSLPIHLERPRRIGRR